MPPQFLVGTLGEGVDVMSPPMNEFINTLYTQLVIKVKEIAFNLFQYLYSIVIASSADSLLNSQSKIEECTLCPRYLD